MLAHIGPVPLEELAALAPLALLALRGRWPAVSRRPS